jgi:hypothetical protein
MHASREKPVHTSSLFVGRDIHSGAVIIFLCDSYILDLVHYQMFPHGAPCGSRPAGARTPAPTDPRSRVGLVKSQFKENK